MLFLFIALYNLFITSAFLCFYNQRVNFILYCDMENKIQIVFLFNVIKEKTIDA